jgi:hypothetical protein
VPKTFGRVLQIRSLPPIVALQLLTSLRAHFDVERLFSILISRGTSAGYIPHLGRDLGAKRFWSFSMKYYYLNVGKPGVYKGQVAGLFHDKEEDLYICRGTALVALSLSLYHFPEGVDEIAPPTPWRLLVLSCNKQTDRRGNPLRNGVEAFLWAIHHELAWVRRSLRHVLNQIASLAVPSASRFIDPTNIGMSLTLEPYRMTFFLIRRSKNPSCLKTKPTQTPGRISGLSSHCEL